MLPFELIKDTPYLALSGELWSVFYEYFNRNWSCYKGFLLYYKLKSYDEWWVYSIEKNDNIKHYMRNSTRSGPRPNIKTVLSTYGDFHVKDKTAVRTSYL